MACDGAVPAFAGRDSDGSCGARAPRGVIVLPAPTGEELIAVAAMLLTYSVSRSATLANAAACSDAGAPGVSDHGH